MKDINEQIYGYFGPDVSKMRVLGITKYAVFIYVLRVQRGWSKQSALRALLQGRSLNAEQSRYVRSVLDRLPSAATKSAGA